MPPEHPTLGHLTFGSITSLDVLCVAPHPDDAEIGCGGTLARAAAEGQKTGILELTRGEMGSKGTPAERDQEALEAAGVLGLQYRGNLRWPDGLLEDRQAWRAELAQVLRALRPRVLLVPHERDRHPDHTGASRVCTAAVHLAGLRNAPLEGAAHKVSQLLFYQGNAPIQANVVIDVSEYLETWRRAIMAHRSQFTGEAVSETVSPDVLERRKARMMYWGTFIGVRYAEAFEHREPLAWVPWNAVH
jgi:bacillithiol biosynthesis deacetylase BshB1